MGFVGAHPELPEFEREPVRSGGKSFPALPQWLRVRWFCGDEGAASTLPDQGPVAFQLAVGPGHGAGGQPERRGQVADRGKPASRLDPTATMTETWARSCS